VQPTLVTVVDHGAGNIRSVAGAVGTLGFGVRVAREPSEIESSRILVLPGVGSFRTAMDRIRSRGIDKAVVRALESGGSILGICLGMQLLCEWSDEDGGTDGFALVQASVTKFGGGETAAPVRIPHVGFNSVTAGPTSILFAGVPPSSDFYFVHSYRIPAIEPVEGLQTATTPYGGDFVSAFEWEGRVFGVQFHPELSQGNGLRVIKNYVESASC